MMFFLQELIDYWKNDKKIGSDKADTERQYEYVPASPRRDEALLRRVKNARDKVSTPRSLKQNMLKNVTIESSVFTNKRLWIFDSWR